MISRWAVYYMLRSDYAQYKMNIYYMYQEVLKIAKREERPRDWFHYRGLLKDIAETEEKCKNLKEEIEEYEHRI